MAIEENGAVDITASSVNGVEELSVSDDKPFVYDEVILAVLANVGKSNLYFDTNSYTDESLNLEELTRLVEPLTSDKITDVEQLSVVNLFVQNGLPEYLFRATLSQRVQLYIMCKFGLYPEGIVELIKGEIDYDHVVESMPEDTKNMVDEAYDALVALGLDDNGDPIRVVLTADKVESTTTPELEELNAATAEAVNATEEATAEASSDTSNTNAAYEEMLNKSATEFNTNSGSDDGISAAGVIGITAGVVLLGAAAYYGYNCFFGDGCEDDITLID